MDGDGNVIRDPNDILHKWTYEQVTDALELKNIRQKAIARMRAATRGGR